MDCIHVKTLDLYPDLITQWADLYSPKCRNNICDSVSFRLLHLTKFHQYFGFRGTECSDEEISLSFQFFNTVRYLIGGYNYSLQDIENGVLRANRKGMGKR